MSEEQTTGKNSGNRSEKESGQNSAKYQNDERHYTLSISEEQRQRSFEIEDERWSVKQQVGDWLKLGLVVLIYLAVTYIVYLYQPGLR